MSFSLQFNPRKRRHGFRSRKSKGSTVFGLGLSIVALHSLIFFSGYIDSWGFVPQTFQTVIIIALCCGNFQNVKLTPKNEFLNL